MKMFMDNDKEYLEDLLVRMAHHSTAIEGNSLTQGETKSIILENYIPRPIDIREVNEVLNYKNLLPYLLEHQKENITISGIQDINRIIMKNIDDRGGKFKIVQNIIAGADFDTTLPFMVPEELKKWTDDLSWRLNHAEKNQDKIEIIMEQHLRFERIHPFPDGNGRTGRALIIWSCLQQGLTPVVIEKEYNREYIECLKHRDLQNLYKLAVKNQKKDIDLVKNDENNEMTKNALKALYNELEDIYNNFPQTDELEVKKAEIQSSVTVIKNKAEYERVKQDLREYEKACMIHRRNLKHNEERENDLGRIRKY